MDVLWAYDNSNRRISELNIAAAVAASSEDCHDRISKCLSSTASEVPSPAVLSSPSTPGTTPLNTPRLGDVNDPARFVGAPWAGAPLPVIVKNTFVDLPGLTDGTDRPSPGALRRTQSCPPVLGCLAGPAAGPVAGRRDAGRRSGPSMATSLRADALPFNPTGSFADYQEPGLNFDWTTYCPHEGWAVMLEEGAHVESIAMGTALPNIPAIADSGARGDGVEAGHPDRCSCRAPDEWPQNQADEAQVQKVFRVVAQDRRTGEVWKMCRQSASSSLAVQEAIACVARAYRCAQHQDDEQSRASALFDMQAILRELRGHVVEALGHPHANYVVQRIIESVPAQHADFVAAELLGSGFWAAGHRFGCRIVLRIFRHLSCGACAGGATLELMDEVVARTGALCCDKFGNYVIQEVLACGLPQHKKEARDCLQQMTSTLSTMRHGRQLLELMGSQAEAQQKPERPALHASKYKGSNRSRGYHKAHSSGSAYTK